MADEARVRWGQYDLYVCPAPNETTWKHEGGVYVFAGLGTNQEGQSVWYGYYVGQTTSFAERLPNHERWDEAAKLGATHVHARIEQDSGQRSLIEHDLIQRFQPTLNVQDR